MEINKKEDKMNAWFVKHLSKMLMGIIGALLLLLITSFINWNHEGNTEIKCEIEKKLDVTTYEVDQATLIKLLERIDAKKVDKDVFKEYTLKMEVINLNVSTQLERILDNQYSFMKGEYTPAKKE